MIRALRISSVVVLCFVLFGCSKSKNGDADAGAIPDNDATVAPAADAAVADAAVADLDAGDAALAVPTATAIVGRPKPQPVDPPICAAARKARDRNSPAAPGLAAQCTAAGGKL